MDKNILNIIKEHQTIRKGEKEKNGEVFTPNELINENLDKLPLAVWKNPDLKWLDPANGIGNFPIVAYYKLMEGLKDLPLYKDENKRSKHIIEEMLFMIEINNDNVEVCKHIFKTINAKAKPNIICADFLNAEQEWKNELMKKKNIESFDIIIGNPPYNSDGIKHKGKKNIYVFFVIKGLAILKKDGYMSYIHPPTYRIPNHKIQHTKTNLNKIYTTKKILCIKMFSIVKTKKLMNVMINVDYIIIQNTANDEKYETKIIDVNEKEYSKIILPNTFIPNYGLNILNKLENSAKLNGNLKIILTSEMHAQITSGDEYKNIHGIKRKGIKICFSSLPHSLQNKRKIIINGIGSYNYIFYDERGEYGFTQSPVAIIEPSTNTLQLIQSKLFHYIADATKIIGNNFNIQTSLFLPIIDEKKIKINNQLELYQYFDFSNEEIEEVEKYSIPQYNINEIV
jgi:hypothetical protein